MKGSIFDFLRDKELTLSEMIFSKETLVIVVISATTYIIVRNVINYIDNLNGFGYTSKYIGKSNEEVMIQTLADEIMDLKKLLSVGTDASRQSIEMLKIQIESLQNSANILNRMQSGIANTLAQEIDVLRTSVNALTANNTVTETGTDIITRTTENTQQPIVEIVNDHSTREAIEQIQRSGIRNVNEELLRTSTLEQNGLNQNLDALREITKHLMNDGHISGVRKKIMSSESITSQMIETAYKIVEYTQDHPISSMIIATSSCMGTITAILAMNPKIIEILLAEKSPLALILDKIFNR